MPRYILSNIKGRVVFVRPDMPRTPIIQVFSHYGQEETRRAVKLIQKALEAEERENANEAA